MDERKLNDLNIKSGDTVIVRRSPVAVPAAARAAEAEAVVSTCSPFPAPSSSVQHELSDFEFAKRLQEDEDRQYKQQQLQQRESERQQAQYKQASPKKLQYDDSSLEHEFGFYLSHIDLEGE